MVKGLGFMAGAVVAALAAEGIDTVDVRFEEPPRPLRPKASPSPEPAPRRIGTSKYMPHTGAKERAKAARRAAKARGEG